MSFSSGIKKLFLSCPLLLVLACAVFLQLHYLSENNLTMYSDSAGHSAHSMEVARGLSHSPLQAFLNTAVRYYRYYPPGYYLTTAISFLLFGYKIWVGIVWQLLYQLGTLALIYHFTRRFSSPRIAALASFMYLCFPVVLGLGRLIFIENLLVLQLMIYLALIFRDRAFARDWIALALGLVAGWGQLTKWQFLAFIGPVTLIMFCLHVRTLLQSRAGWSAWERSFVWVGIASAAFSLIALPWYYSNLPDIVSGVRYNSFVLVWDSAPRGEWRAILFYFQSFPMQMVGVPLSLVICMAFISALCRWRTYGSASILAWSVLGTILLMNLIVHKQGRFIMPMLAPCAVITAIWVFKQSKWVKRCVSAFILFFSVLNATTHTYDLSWLIPEKYVPIGFDRRGFIVRYGVDWVMSPISKADWRINHVFQVISERSGGQNIAPTVAWQVEQGDPYYVDFILRAYVSMYGGRAEDIESANFIIYRLPVGVFDVAERIQKRTGDFELGRWILPDGGEVRLFQRMLKEIGRRDQGPLSSGKMSS